MTGWRLEPTVVYVMEISERRCQKRLAQVVLIAGGVGTCAIVDGGPARPRTNGTELVSTAETGSPW